MNVKIGKYSVSVRRGRAHSHTKTLSLQASSSATGTFKSFALFFYENPPNLGYVNPDNGYVVPMLPEVDFDPMYHLIQTERPIYAGWQTNDDNKLEWFSLYTGEEPPGEGLAEKSNP